MSQMTCAWPCWGEVDKAHKTMLSKSLLLETRGRRAEVRRPAGVGARGSAHSAVSRWTPRSQEQEGGSPRPSPSKSPGLPRDTAVSGWAADAQKNLSSFCTRKATGGSDKVRGSRGAGRGPESVRGSQGQRGPAGVA